MADSVQVTIRDHAHVSTSTTTDVLAGEIFQDAYRAANTFGSAEFIDGARWVGHCPEHTDNAVPCFEGVVNV